MASFGASQLPPRHIMRSAGPSGVAQGSYPTDYPYDDSDDREELVPPDLTRSVASSGVSSSSSTNKVDVDGPMSGFDHGPCLGPMTPPRSSADNHSPLSTISFRIGTSPSSLTKTTMAALGPGGKLCIKQESENSERKSLLGRISSFGRSRLPAVEMKRRSWSPLSFSALPRSLGYKNPTHPAKPARESVDLSTCIHVEGAPVPSPCHNAPTLVAASAAPRTEPTQSSPCIGGPGSSPATGAINVARSGTSSVASPNPAVAADAIMSDSPLPASNIPPPDLSSTYPPSSSGPLPRAPPRQSPFSTSPQDPHHRLTWFSDAPLPCADVCASPESPGLRRFHRKRPFSPAGKRYWFQCTHADGLPSTTFASDTQKTADDSGAGLEKSSFRSSHLVALLRHSTILERVLQYLTWAEFSALANANHVLRSFFEFDLVDSGLKARARREKWRVRQVVLKRYLPGCDPSWSSWLSGSSSPHHHREDGVHPKDDEIHVSMVDLDILIQSQQVPLAVYPTQALVSLSSFSFEFSGAQPPRPSSPRLVSSEPSRPTSPAFSVTVYPIPNTRYDGDDGGIGDINEMTRELARMAMAHSKFVALLRHRAIRYRMHFKQFGGHNIDTVEFPWRKLYMCMGIHGQSSLRTAVHGVVSLPPGVGAGTGVGSGGKPELRFPAPLSYFSVAGEEVPPLLLRKENKAAKSGGGAMTDPDLLPPSSSHLPYPPSHVTSTPPSTTLTKKLKTALTHLGGPKPHSPLPPPKPTQDPSVAWHRVSRYLRHHHLGGDSLGSATAGPRRTNPPSSTCDGSISGREWAALSYAGAGSSAARRGTLGTGHRRSSSLPGGSAVAIRGTRAVGMSPRLGAAPSNPMLNTPASFSSFSLLDFHIPTAAPRLGSDHPLSVQQHEESAVMHSPQSQLDPLDISGRSSPYSRTHGNSFAEDWNNEPFYTGASIPNNAHALHVASNPYFAPIYRVYIPTSSPSSDPAVIAECDAQLRLAGVLGRWVQAGDVVANLGSVPVSSPSGNDNDATLNSDTSQDAGDPSWMVYDGRDLIRFDPKNPPLSSCSSLRPQVTKPLPVKHGRLGTPALKDDAIEAGVPCPTYYVHILPKGMNPIWPLSIPVHLLPPPPPPPPRTLYPSGVTVTEATRSSNGVASYWARSGAVKFALIPVAKYVPSHLGPIRVQQFAWTVRCDFPSRTHAREDHGESDKTKTGLGLWAGEWILEAEGTHEGRAALEQVLEDSYQFGYAQPGVSVWRWEVVLELCEGNMLWLRLL